MLVPSLLLGLGIALSRSELPSDLSSLLPARTPAHEAFRWGIYQIYTGHRRFERHLDHTLSQLASRPHFVMFYRDLIRPFPEEGCRIVQRIGATPIISLELWHWERNPANRLPDLNAGVYDQTLRSWARAAREYGDEVWLRFGFEMNGDWFTWGNQPGPFVQAWRRIHGIFREEGAENVLWVWSPNCVSIPRTAENAIELYYPGDQYVDWVALDGYNFGDHHDQWHRWESFEEIFAPGLELFAREYPEKPVMIAEFACAPGEPGQKAEWIRQTFAQIAARKEIEVVVWFNLDKRREREPNWLIWSEPDALEAFNETFASPDLAPTNPFPSPAD